MKTILIAILLLPIYGYSQFKIKNMNVARSGVAYDFIEDTIMLVGGSESDVVEYYDINSENIKRQEKYTSDGFTGASVISNDKYAVFYNLFSVNLSIRDLLVYDKILKKWSDRKGANVGGAFVTIEGSKIYSYGNKDSISVYDLVGNKNSKIAIPVIESNYSVASSDDKLFFIGGELNGNTFSKSIHIFDKFNNTWSHHTLVNAVRSPEVLYYNNKIFIAGGFNNFSRKLEIFDVNSKTSELIDLERTYRDCLMLPKDNKLLIGAGDENSITTIDLTTNQIIKTEILEPQAGFVGLKNLKGSILGNKAYFAGGYYPRIHVYNFDDDSWEVITLNNAIYDAAVFNYKNKVYIVGGEKYPQNKVFSNEILIFENLSSSNNDIIAGDDEIQIYPNPSKDLVNWKSENAIIESYILYDTQGKVIKKGNGTPIDISNFSSGKYNLILISSTGVKYVKGILVEK